MKGCRLAFGCSPLTCLLTCLLTYLLTYLFPYQLARLPGCPASDRILACSADSFLSCRLFAGLPASLPLTDCRLILCCRRTVRRTVHRTVRRVFRRFFCRAVHRAVHRVFRLCRHPVLLPARFPIAAFSFTCLNPSPLLPVCPRAQKSPPSKQLGGPESGISSLCEFG